MVASLGCGGEGLDVPLADIDQPWVPDSIGPSVISAESTWRLSDDTPFFDPRLIVDTCAQFVSSSLQARTTGELLGKNGAKSRASSKGKVDKDTDKEQNKHGNGRSKNVTLLQAMTCHAHEYMGAERLVLELVPRCREFREQLRQTVRPLCAEMKNSGLSGPAIVNDAVMDYEVDRFFRARLVVCDLSELLCYDCFVEEGTEDEALSRHRAVTKIPEFADGEPDRRDYQLPYDAALELTVERFEHRFWRTFSHGLGRSLFGERTDLVNGFQASAQDVFDRYEGELQLAMNSLMGWLPSWLSDSLFIAFVGAGAGVAVRQKAAKFTMLHRCVKSLIQSSGRYVFINTPAWYLPLVNWLPGLGRKEMLRMPSVSLSLSLRTVWPAPCLDPDHCVTAVDNVWGGPKGVRRAHLKLADGVEAMGSWILRMTLGCEQLFSEALKVLQEYAPLFEEAYDELVEAEQIPKGALPVNQAAARRLSQISAVKIYDTATAHRRQARRQSQKCQKRRSSCPRKSALQAGGRGGNPEHLGRPQISLLAQLHVDSHGPVTSHGPRLRSAIATGQGKDTVWWPLGQSDTFRERIPIHRTPDLIPTAAPPILEDVSVPSEYRLPEAASHNSSIAPGTEASLGPGELAAAASTASLGLESPNARHNRSTSTKGGEEAKDKDSFNAEGWQLQWFGLGASGANLHTKSAPQLTMPEDFRETLDRMWKTRGSNAEGQARRLKKRGTEYVDAMTSRQGNRTMGFAAMSKFAKVRCRSAPAAVDTSDFDVGDPARNTAVALALQAQMRMALASACSEGPLRLAWRQPKYSRDITLLRRARLNLGSVLLLAAMRAPLPTWEELPLEHFVTLGEEVPRTTLPPPKVRLPDGIYALGCSPLFHYVATEDSARLPPLMAQSFHIGVPHTFLEDAPIRDAVLDRRQDKRWSEGSLLVLLMAAAFTESHLASRVWASQRGWVQQDYSSFFPLACCFRLVLGLEFLWQWQNQLTAGEGCVTLEEFFPILEGVESANRRVSVRMDASTADGAKPLLIAPWILPPKPASDNFDPDAIGSWDRAYHPGCEAAGLSEFAQWVACLAPGRVVYSSHRSPTGDLYMRLEDAVIVFAFCATGNLLSGQEIFNMYEDAIGDPKWWKVAMVTYIIMPSNITQGLEMAIANSSCKVYNASEMLDGWSSASVIARNANHQTVRANSELIVCNPKMLSAFLGPLGAPAFGHTKLFQNEIAQEEEEEEIVRAIWMARYDAEQEEREEELRKRHESQQQPTGHIVDGMLRRAVTAPALPLPKSGHRHTIQGVAGEVMQQPRAHTAAPASREDNRRRVSTEANFPSAREARKQKFLSQIADEAEDSQSEKGCSRPASMNSLPSVANFSQHRGSNSLAKRGDDARVLAKRLASQRSQALRMPKTKLAQGSPGSYVDWRNKRAGKPKAQQLIQNLEALTGLFTYIEEHCKSLDETLPDRSGRRSSTTSHSRSNLSSRGRIDDDDDDDMADKDMTWGGNEEVASDSDASSFDSDETHSDEREADDGTFELTMDSARDHELGRLGDKADDGFVNCEVRIARVPSPQRTEKSRSWRPPSPFPRRDIEAESIMKGAPRPYRGPLGTFDFCGFGNWRKSMKEPSSKDSKMPKRTRSSMMVQ